MRTLRQVEEEFRGLDEREGRINQFYEKNKLRNARNVKINGGVKRYQTQSFWDVLSSEKLPLNSNQMQNHPYPISQEQQQQQFHQSISGNMKPSHVDRSTARQQGGRKLSNIDEHLKEFGLSVSSVKQSGIQNVNHPEQDSLGRGNVPKEAKSRKLLSQVSNLGEKSAKQIQNEVSKRSHLLGEKYDITRTKNNEYEENDVKEHSSPQSNEDGEKVPNVRVSSQDVASSKNRKKQEPSRRSFLQKSSFQKKKQSSLSSGLTIKSTKSKQKDNHYLEVGELLDDINLSPRTSPLVPSPMSSRPSTQGSNAHLFSLGTRQYTPSPSTSPLQNPEFQHNPMRSPRKNSLSYGKPPLNKKTMKKKKQPLQQFNVPIPSIDTFQRDSQLDHPSSQVEASEGRSSNEISPLSTPSSEPDLYDRKDHYYFQVKIRKKENVNDTLYDVKITMDDCEQYSMLLKNLSVDEENCIIFNNPEDHIFSPVDRLPWISEPRDLLGHSLRIEVYGTFPSKTRVADSTIQFKFDPERSRGKERTWTPVKGKKSETSSKNHDTQIAGNPSQSTTTTTTTEAMTTTKEITSNAENGSQMRDEISSEKKKPLKVLRIEMEKENVDTSSKNTKHPSHQMKGQFKNGAIEKEEKAKETYISDVKSSSSLGRQNASIQEGEFSVTNKVTNSSPLSRKQQELALLRDQIKKKLRQQEETLQLN